MCRRGARVLASMESSVEEFESLRIVCHVSFLLMGGSLVHSGGSGLCTMHNAHRTTPQGTVARLHDRTTAHHLLRRGACQCELGLVIGTEHRAQGTGPDACVKVIVIMPSIFCS
jgi:hypothetical protein